MPEAAAVRSMFARIAPRYDRANRILSLGLDPLWRRALVRSVVSRNARHVLDLATGSGDVAFALHRHLPPAATITGGDFCEPLLEVARARAARLPGATPPRVAFVTADALSLPFEPAAFDAVTISFGLRNLEDRARGLAEMRRVLRPGGSLHVLEFSQPACWFHPLYFPYLRHVCPRVARHVTGDRDAYLYLGDTIAAFPDRPALAAELRTAGFADVTHRPLTAGVVAIHVGTR